MLGERQAGRFPPRGDSEPRLVEMPTLHIQFPRLIWAPTSLGQNHGENNRENHDWELPMGHKGDEHLALAHILLASIQSHDHIQLQGRLGNVV